MEQYRTEDEQVQALARWWKENGRSTAVAVVVALSAIFGWRAWQSNAALQQEQASDIYQELVRALGTQEASPGTPAGVELAEQLKREYGSSTYAQFAALHLAALAVKDGKLSDAEAQLRWVLGKAPAGSDTAQIAQQRLARVLAASGDIEQALSILGTTETGSYGASYAAAQGDILLAAGRKDEARAAFTKALALANSSSSAGVGEAPNLPVLQQKLQSLTPVPVRTPGVTESAAVHATDAAPTADVAEDTTNAAEE